MAVNPVSAARSASGAVISSAFIRVWACARSATALLRATPPIAWLVGGRDKGADLAPLRAAAQGRVTRVIAFGEDGENLASELGLPFESVRGEGGDEVLLNAARAGLSALRATGGTVLLAPIGTSFDLFKDYKARGESFKQAAQMLATQPLAAAPAEARA